MSASEMLTRFNNTISSRIGIDLSAPDVVTRFSNKLSIENKLRDIAPSSKSDFNLINIEQLLEQANGLLERIMKDRAYYDDQKAKFLLLMLETSKNLKLHAVHENEVAHGAYKTKVWQQEKECRYLARQISDTQAILNRKNNSFDANWSPAKMLRISKCHGFITQHSNKDNPQKMDMRETTEEIQLHAHETRHQELGRDIESTNMELEQAKESLKWSEELLNYYNYEEGFLGKRKEITAESLSRQMDSLLSDTGILNYEKYLGGLSERMICDFGEAMARLELVRDGLLLLFGAGGDLPDVSASPSSLLDKLLLWIREKQFWLTRFCRKDQSGVISVSARKLLGEQKWKRGFVGGEWSLDVSSNFYDVSHVRLRGVSLMTVANKHREAIWSCTIQAPNTAVVQHRDGRKNTINQSALSPCLLGRVRDYRSLMPQDVCGSVLLNNASPIGEWKIYDLNTILYDAKSDMSEQIDDMILSMYVVFQK